MNRITKKQADILGQMYNVMVDVYNGRKRFDQSDVDYCVMGHSIKAGVFGKKMQKIADDTRLDKAFYQVRVALGLPSLYNYYLFETPEYVMRAGDYLGLPHVKSSTPLQAAKRIETILNLHDYELV